MRRTTQLLTQALLTVAVTAGAAACGSTGEQPEQSIEQAIEQMSPEDRAANECAAAVQFAFNQMYALTMTGQEAASQAAFEDFYETWGLESEEFEVLQWALGQTGDLVNGITTEDAVARSIGGRCGVT